MGLKKVTGSRILVDLQEDVRESVDPPTIVVYWPARAFFKALAMDLLGVTAITAEPEVEAVRQAAAALDESDEADWTQADARRILQGAGSLPGPSHIQVTQLKGSGVMLIRAAKSTAPKAKKLNYSDGTRRAQVSLLAALRKEGLAVPKGMAMEVPVKLVEDEEGLALAAYMRRGKLRNATEEDAGSASAT